MAFNGKHIVAVIGGVRCTVVESGIDENRMLFLKNLLEFNSYEVKTQKDESGNYQIGVTDLVFNPTIDVYKRRLKTTTGHIVTPSLWLQIADEETEREVNYWVK